LYRDQDVAGPKRPVPKWPVPKRRYLNVSHPPEQSLTHTSNYSICWAAAEQILVIVSRGRNWANNDIRNEWWKWLL